MTSHDPITVAVLRGYFDSTANEMEATLLKTAEGTMINQSLDATAAIFDAEGHTIAQADALPCHLGMLIEAMQHVLRTFPVDHCNEGDVFLLNDPYSGGTHLPDFAVFAPVIHDHAVVAFTATMAHHTDVGGVAPGSTATTAIDVHAEGIRFPPLKIVDQGAAQEQLLTLLEYNSRNGSALRGDLEAQIAACRVGTRRLQQACVKWGADTILAVSGVLMNTAEQATRASLQSIPDGSYEFVDYLDSDGSNDDPIPIKVRVEVDGSDIHFDFTGTGQQCAGAINCTAASTMSAVYYAVRVLCPQSIPNNQGCYRPITATLPFGSIVNAAYPAPVGARSVTFKRVTSAAMGALARAVPDRMTAANDGQSSLIYIGGPTGVEPLGLPFPGGMGARPNKDGIDVVDTDLTNAYNVPIEITESKLPLMVTELRLWADSGGAGEYRGGLGYQASVVWLGDDAWFSLRRDRHKFAPWGIAGGAPAPVCAYSVERASGDVEELPSKGVYQLHRGDRLRVLTTGGGGYGPPGKRSAERVASDVAERRVSIAAAREQYGVALTPDGQVDGAMTARLRNSRTHPGGEG